MHVAILLPLRAGALKLLYDTFESLTTRQSRDAETA
jgi:hypothetical protein